MPALILESVAKSTATRPNSHMMAQSEWIEWDTNCELLGPPPEQVGTFELSPTEVSLVAEATIAGSHANPADADVVELLAVARAVIESRLEFKELNELLVGSHPVSAALGSAIGHAVNQIAAGPKLAPLCSNHGRVHHRAGLIRMAALDLLVSVAAVRSPFLDAALASTDAPVHAMQLFYWNVWSNPIHVAVERLMQCCLSSECPKLVQSAMTPVIPRSIAHAHNVLKASGKPLHTVCGFTTHLVAISTALLTAQERTGQSSLGDECWAEFVAKELPPLVRVIEDQTPCGGLPLGFPKNMPPAQSFMEWCSGQSGYRGCGF